MTSFRRLLSHEALKSSELLALGSCLRLSSSFKVGRLRDPEVHLLACCRVRELELSGTQAEMRAVHQDTCVIIIIIRLIILVICSLLLLWLLLLVLLLLLRLRLGF